MKKEKDMLFPKKFVEEIVEEVEKISSKKRICSSCANELPEVLDRRICPHCEKRTG